MRQMIRAAYSAGVPVAITDAARRHLKSELGTDEAVVEWLAELVKTGDRAIAINISGPDGTSTTAVIGPPNWTRERLAGHIATMREELKDEFGDFTMAEVDPK